MIFSNYIQDDRDKNFRMCVCCGCRKVLEICEIRTKDGVVSVLSEGVI